jgi:hypothetical protein
MEPKRVHELRIEIQRLEVDARSAAGSTVLLSKAEQKRFDEARARIAVLRRQLGEQQ